MVLLVSLRDQLRALWRSRPLPLLALSAYALVHVLSAGFAAENRTLAFKFAARMAVMAAFAWLVAAAPASARRRALAALVAAGAVVAALAVAEGVGVRGLDPFLAYFREMPFNVGGSRRATAGSEYPNQAAAWLLYALVAAACAPACARVLGVASVSTLLGLGLLFTYSRGALVAALAGLLAAGLAATGRGGLARGPRVAALALLATSAAFASSREVFRLRLASEGTAAWYGARYEPVDARLSLRPRQALRLRVKVTNTGRKTWARDEGFHLSYHWYHPGRRRLQDGGRTRLPGDLAPGDGVWLEPEVVAPDMPGRYRLVWDMVHERTTWFSGQGVRPVVVEALVGEMADADGAAAETGELPRDGLGWRPGRAELWGIAVSMWRSHPLLGVGPDNFRWLYGPFAGEPFWDTRVFANNTLLESAATTGTLGLLALAVALASALWTSLRSFRDRPDPQGLAWLGLGAAVAAHGLVDYLLAFTGHYLFLGFLIGGSASRGDRT